MSNFNDQTKHMLKALDENYDLSIIYNLHDNKKIYLGDKNNKVCRFCNKDKTETSFKNISHAIPELIGNRTLIAYYECDNCNQKFSKLLESHFGNYMNILHTISQVKGKRKVPSFKTTNSKSANNSRIDVNKNFSIENYEDDNIIEIDFENKNILINVEKRSYVPIAVYKTFVKMALTIMPEKELIYFIETLAWINEEDHSTSRYDIKNLIVLYSFTPGINPHSFVSCMLYKRKEYHKDTVPYMQFLLAYGNFTFQIYLPLCVEDKKFIGTNMLLTNFPTPLDLNGEKMFREQLDMHSRIKVKDEKSTVSLSFEDIKEEDISNEVKE